MGKDSIPDFKKRKLCPFCNKTFSAGKNGTRRIDSKFCSDEHRIKFHAERRVRSSQYEEA